jgi:hypothetical protein
MFRFESPPGTPGRVRACTGSRRGREGVTGKKGTDSPAGKLLSLQIPEFAGGLRCTLAVGEALRIPFSSRRSSRGRRDVCGGLA